MVFNYKKIFNIHVVILMYVFFLIGCGSSKEAPSIELNVSGGVDIEYSTDRQVFYVLNSDYDRSYRDGSILAVDTNGTKLFSESTPRMGRKLKLVDDVMIALFDMPESSEFGVVNIYKIGTDAKLNLIKSWTDVVKCSPVNVALVSGYPYFALSCSNGNLFIGDIGGSFLKNVRNYTTPHRAVVIDPASQLVLSFPSSDNTKYVKDYEYTDLCSYSESSNKCDPSLNSNGIDDEYETNGDVYSKGLKNLRKYQVGIYSIKKELDKSEENRFGFEEIKGISEELKFLYEPVDVEKHKYKYKTGYWDSFFYGIENEVTTFYMSRRTNETNEILKVSLKKKEISVEDKWSDIFQFDIVQSKTELSNESFAFPGKILIQKIGGVPYLVANHFKDFMHFSQDDMSYGYSFKNLNTGKVYEIISKELNESYYGFSITEEGKMLTSSFYGKSLIPMIFNETNGVDIGWGDVKTIR